MTDEFVDPQTGEITEQPAAAPLQPRRRRAKKKGNGRVPIPENETPRDRFLRRSTTQMTNALTAIDLIASFGRNRANYDYDEAAAVRLASRLEDALANMRRELARPPSREEERKAARDFKW